MARSKATRGGVSNTQIPKEIGQSEMAQSSEPSKSSTALNKQDSATEKSPGKKLLDKYESLYEPRLGGQVMSHHLHDEIKDKVPSIPEFNNLMKKLENDGILRIHRVDDPHIEPSIRDYGVMSLIKVLDKEKLVKSINDITKPNSDSTKITGHPTLQEKYKNIANDKEIRLRGDKITLDTKGLTKSIFSRQVQALGMDEILPKIKHGSFHETVDVDKINVPEYIEINPKNFRAAMDQGFEFSKSVLQYMRDIKENK